MTGHAPTAAPGESVDAFLGGRVTLIQKTDGHRVGLDAALLQALVPGDATGLAIDLGSGVGAVALALAARVPALHVVGIEREAALVACGTAALTLAANASFAARVRLMEADVEQLPPDVTSERAGWVLMNPPYDERGRGTASPNRLRRDAHVAPAGTLALWIDAAARLLRDGGRVGIVHRADALGGILAALAPLFGSVALRPVHPMPDAPARRILITARRGRGAPLSVLPALILHEPGGAWTSTADAILRGRAELSA